MGSAATTVGQRGESLGESLRELRELRVFCLRACPLEDKKIEKNKGTNIILIDWRIKNDFFLFSSLLQCTAMYSCAL